MSKTKAFRKYPSKLIFVLWGSYFDEATAIIFATKLRQAGLCVKLVGVASQLPSGKNGVALSPDLPLRDALAMSQDAICIILPCSAATLRHVAADPRIGELLQDAHANHAQFIIPSADLVENTGLKKLFGAIEPSSTAPSKTFLTYAQEENLPQFAKTIAERLAERHGI